MSKSIATTIEKSLKLYGIKVPAEKYNTIKRIADLLVGETSVDVPIQKARKLAVKIAVNALVQMNPSASWFLEYF